MNTHRPQSLAASPLRCQPACLPVWLAVLLVSVTCAFAQTTILSENFDAVYNNLAEKGWLVGDADGSGTYATWNWVDYSFGGEGAHSGSYKGYCAAVGYSGTTTSPLYQNYMDAYMARSINLSGYDSATLTFWYKMPSLETCCDRARVYIDGTQVWSSGSTASSWTQATISLNVYVGGSHTLKFQFESDFSVTGEGWYLDDIVVTAANDPAPASMAGKRIRAYITYGAGSLASYGAFDIVTAATGNTYQIVPVSGPVASSSGSYSYTKLGSPVGTLVLHSTSGMVEAIGLSFYSATSGYFEAQVTSGNYGTQSGSFDVLSPGVMVLTSPASGAALQYRPYFNWTLPVPGAEWFRLYITRNGSVYWDQWLQLTTGWFPTAALPAGSYSWWVQPYNSAGLGPWSQASTFTMLVPGTTLLFSPEGQLTSTSTERYNWRADGTAAWYELYVTRNGSAFLDKWYNALTDSVVDTGTGNFAVDVSGHSAGTYQWYVRGWNSDGLGPWSGPGSFTMVPRPLPGAVTLQSPANSANVTERQPQFTWSYSSNYEEEWYYLYLTRNGSKYLDQWVNRATNGPQWKATASLPAGSYAWAVRPWNTTGYGPWSSVYTFTIQPVVPGTITLISPSIAAYGATQRYTWRADPAAVWYELYITRNLSAFVDRWFTLSNSVGTSGNFAVDVGGHTTGGYQWYVRGWSPDGTGPWSGPLSFALPY